VSKRPFIGRILQLSAKSDEPLEEEILRDFAQAVGEDPDGLVKSHQELMEVFERKIIIGPLPKLKRSPKPTKD